ncbi:protein KTI12 homolog [Phlebotomus argentipes]|uniref:protein KTI12 homolog n=1 Tax=Phlebotomus argentipes TaxID=94469 RepID=UPI00289377C0|nr:protein KTI12 homolog [Phlebotomus argentipes]
MPLIILSGIPSSGKTTRAQQLEKFFREEKNLTVHVVSENKCCRKHNFLKNDLFSDSQKEKIIRASLKSEVGRLQNTKDVVILDASNYIKGYRYELYCQAKGGRVTQCTILCNLPVVQAKAFNQQRPVVSEELPDSSEPSDNSDVQYTEAVFDALCQRFEEPQGTSRWDAPLFVTLPDQELDFSGIYQVLFENKLPTPNQSTQNAPVCPANYLCELDQISRGIVMEIVAARKHNPGIISIAQHQKGATPLTVNIPAEIGVAQLRRLRQMFLNYIKVQPTPPSLDSLPQLFVRYINSNYGDS